MKYHKTKNGDKIKISDLEQGHLENIVRWMEKKSIDGLTVRSGGGTCADDMYYDEDEYYGAEALRYMGYQYYKDELIKRTKK